jgi:hypothetical protein
LDGHQVVVRFLAAFGRRCRPQFECPACARGCARLYNVPEAFHPWRCLRCAGLEYRAKHLKPIERAERAFARLALEGRERKPRERRKHYYRRFARLIAAEKRFTDAVAAYLELEKRRGTS